MPPRKQIGPILGITAMAIVLVLIGILLANSSAFVEPGPVHFPPATRPAP